MIPRPTTILFLLAAGCGTTWEAVDADGDGFTRQQGDCWDAVEGPGGLAGADIHPDATDTWYDGIDQDCDGADDYDQDGDGYVSNEHGGLPTLGVSGSGQLPAGDCWDDPTAVDAHAVVPSSLEDKQGALLSWEQPAAADVHPGASETFYDGVDSDCAGDDDFDRDADGWRTDAYPDADGSFGEDCIDGADLDADNPASIPPESVNPDADEVWYDGTDQDCDENDCDADYDGYDGGDGVHCTAEDCDDGDAAILPDPAVEEVWYNGVDENCDANDGDADGDGYWVEDYEQRVAASGSGLEPLEVPKGYAGDCDDTDAGAYPSATEIWYDGTDQDCDGLSDYDADYDGYDAEDHGGEDCDDTSGSINPMATEIWYDGTDQDCDHLSDYDADYDGFDSDAFAGNDCDDADASINPAADEIWYDGTDQDCDHLSDYDADYDGFVSEDWGGDDCNDGAPGIHPGATERWYDGTDQDCDGLSDYDADRDGYDSDGHGGDDCDDLTASTHPGADELWDTADNDCNGLVDDLLAEDAAAEWFDGDTGTFLGFDTSLSWGDIDDDGVPELMLGATLDESSRGTVWVLDATPPGLPRGGLASSYASAELQGPSSESFMAVMGPEQGDLNGDAVADLLVAGTDPYGTGDAVVALYLGGSGFGGLLTPSSADLVLTQAYGAEPPRVLSHLDMDGEGLAELIFADWSLDNGLYYLDSPVYRVELDGLSGSTSLYSAYTDVLTSWSNDDDLGRSLGGGDLDGDGYDDVFVGAPGYSEDGAGGFVGVYPGSGSGTSWAAWGDFASQASLVVLGASGGGLGSGGASLLGDLDHDSATDLIVADPASDAVYVILAAAGAFGSTIDVADADLTIQGEGGSLFGQAMAVGDFTGDGQDDLYIGAPGSYDPSAPSTSWSGAATLFDGSLLTGSSATTADASATLLPSQASMLGAAILGLDLSGDAALEPVLAAPARDGAGRIWLISSP